MLFEQKVHELVGKQALETYRREAEIYRLLPKSSLRRRFALLLKTWAETLEPSLGKPSLERKTLSV